MKKLLLLAALPVSSFACEINTTGDGLWPDVVTEYPVCIGHDVTIPPGYDILTSDSVIVSPQGRLAGTSGSITFVTPPASEYQGVDYVPSDVGLWVFGELDIRGAETTSWVNAVPEVAFELFQYGTERAVAIRSGTAVLESAPVGWSIGDTLVVSTEQGDYSLATLTNISGNRIAFLADKALTGYSIKYRDMVVYPKVGNLSRDFVIEGGHTSFMKDSTINVFGAEFKNGGKRGVLGRYPVHFHEMGQTTASLVGSSIWSDDYSNRWVALHSTQGAIISNNIMLRSQGHGVFMEMGDEYDNKLVGNLTIDVQYPEELPNVDDNLFKLVTSGSIGKTSNHFWVRQGNTYTNNASVGGDINAWPRYPNFGWLHGMAMIHGSKKVDTVVDGYECLGCGGFGAWTYVREGGVTVRNSHFIYNRVAGWYPVLDDTILEDSLAALNTWNTPWEGQVFAQTFDGNRAVVRNSHLAGAYGVNLHYVGDLVIEGGSITATWPIKPNYYENTLTLNGVEISGDQLVSPIVWGTHKRNAPVPIWINNSTFNGKPIEGMFVRHPTHSRFFETIGDPIGPAIQVVPEPAYWLPKPAISGQGYIDPKTGAGGDRYYRSVTPIGQEEGPVAASGEYFSFFERSYELGNMGYPHGFPAGTYEIEYYDYRTGNNIRKPIPLNLSETFSVGDAPMPNRPPEAELLFSELIYQDTDGQPGEYVTVNGTGIDPDGDVLLVEWLVNGEGQSTELMPALFFPDGASLLTLRVSDGEYSDEITVEIVVGEPETSTIEEVKSAIIEILNDAVRRIGEL